MKPDVKAKLPKVQPAAPPAKEPSLLSPEGLRRNRGLLIGIGAGLAVVLLVLAGVGLQNHLAATANTHAWHRFAEVRPGLAISAAFFGDPSRTPDERRRAIEQVLDEVKGTSAEPWVLFDLGDAYFGAGQPEKAREIFVDIRDRFPNHVLVDRRASYRGASRVGGAIEDCDREIEWLSTHARPALKSPSPSEPPASPDAPDTTGSVDAPVDAPDEPRPEDGDKRPSDTR